MTTSAPDDTPVELTFTLTPADADAVKRGELDLSVAFMRGTMKMAGDSGVLFHVLPVLARRVRARRRLSEAPPSSLRSAARSGAQR